MRMKRTSKEASKLSKIHVGGISRKKYVSEGPAVWVKRAKHEKKKEKKEQIHRLLCESSFSPIFPGRWTLINVFGTARGKNAEPSRNQEANLGGSIPIF